jgi:hypothetical protein
MLSQITSFKLSNDDEFVAAAGIYFANTGARPTGERRADMNRAQWRGISIVNAITGPTQTCIPIAVGIGFGGIRVAVPFLPQSGTRIPTFPSDAPL